MSVPLLQTSALTRHFGGLAAVREVSLACRVGELHAVIGPNGAGKSTTFNLISGVAKPTSGAATFAGRDITSATARDVARLGMARTFQHVKLLPEMSVLENVALGLPARGSSGQSLAQLRQRFAAITASYGLQLDADRPVQSLSGIALMLEVLSSPSPLSKLRSLGRERRMICSV